MSGTVAPVLLRELEGRQVAHFGVESDGAMDGKALAPDGTYMFLATSDITSVFKVKDKNNKVVEAVRELDFHGFATVGMCATPANNCMLLLTKASFDSEDDKSEEPIPYTVKEYNPKGKCVRKIKIGKLPFGCSGIACDSTRIVVAISNTTSTVIRVYNRGTNALTKEYIVPEFREAYRVDIQASTGHVLLGNDTTLSLINDAGEVVYSTAIEDMSDAIVTAFGEIVVSTTKSTVLILSPILVPTGKQIVVSLNRATSLFPDYDEDDEDSHSGSSDDSASTKSSKTSMSSGSVDISVEAAFSDIVDLFYADSKLFVRTASDDILVYV